MRSPGAREDPFDEVIDCRGQVLLPGLINTHTHIHETMMRGLGHDLPFHDWCDRLVFPTAEAMEAVASGLSTRLTPRGEGQSARTVGSRR